MKMNLAAYMQVVLFLMLVFVLGGCGGNTSAEQALYAYQTGDYETADSYYSFTVANNPHDAEALLYHGLCCFQQKQYEPADSAFSFLIKKKQHTQLAYRSRGELSLLTGNYERAITDFSEYIKKDSANPQIFFYRGCCYYLIDVESEARKDWYMTKELNFDTELDYALLFDNYLFLK